jgi:hypothetical protein
MSVIRDDHVRMTTFREFQTSAPEIADRIADRLRTTGIGLLGTVRRDGSPRVSPIEVTLQGDGLFVGMMPGSAKCDDVLRDPRVCLLTPVADREDLGGEGKLFGRLERITDPARAAAVLTGAAEAAGLDADALGDSPMFELDVTAAAWQYADVTAESFHTLSWRAGTAAVRRRRRQGALGLPEDE